jgi:hypothetical protein
VNLYDPYPSFPLTGAQPATIHEALDRIAALETVVQKLFKIIEDNFEVTKSLLKNLSTE